MTMNASDANMGSKELIQKFWLRFVDKATGEQHFYEEENLNAMEMGLRRISLPFSIDKFKADDLLIRLYTRADKYNVIDDFKEFLYLVTGKGDDIDELKERVRQDEVLANLPDGYFKPLQSEGSFPRMIYCDVTEKDMFGYEAITSSMLKKTGVWGMHGLRKLEIKLEGYNPNETEPDFEQKVSLYWNQIDSTKIDDLAEKDVHYDPNRKVFYAYVDTNQLQRAIEENNIESLKPSFRGRFEVHNNYKTTRQAFSFPIEICVRDVVRGARNSDFVNRRPVSIDFGTSSTCAAVQGTGMSELFTLSGPAKRDASEGDNAYENPTNIMIYSWDTVYDQWRSEYHNCPFFVSKSADVDEKEADYDSGYTVEDEYKDVDAEEGRRKMAAIMTQLKSIPYLLAHGKEVKFVPYRSLNRAPITVTDTLEGMGEFKFNPIAFYGYLLGRAINNPAKGTVYTKYQITFPVKFDKEVREKIRVALEFGICRAIPKAIREAVDKKGKKLVSVAMNYPEPVACIGSIVGKQLKVTKEDSGAKLFAIYDLGGGTMDFAFGIFRNANDEEAEEHDQTIELLGVDGDDQIGGEKLIHKLAYKIYKDNRDYMESNGIKFVLPERELYPEGFDGLLSKVGDDIADSNVNSIKEKLARVLFKCPNEVDNRLTEIFQDENVAPAADSFRLDLRGKNGEDIESDKKGLKVSDVDDFLEKEIQYTIDAFAEKMEECFQKNLVSLHAAGIEAYHTENVHIFLGGNASKQHWVEELMNERFKNNRIERIGMLPEGAEQEDVGDQYKVNEKTAVAFGQLRLGDYVVDLNAIKRDDDMPPFGFNVGYINSGSNEFELVLAKSEISREWKCCNRIDAESGSTNLCYTTNPKYDRNTLIPLCEDISDFIEEESNKRTLYIRPYEEDSIEFRLSTRKEAPQMSEEVNKDMILKLKV